MPREGARVLCTVGHGKTSVFPIVIFFMIRCKESILA